MFLILIGPKGSGKSHVGRVLERQLGVFFFHVEPLWMDYHARCRAAGHPPTIAEGIATVHPHVRRALLEHEHLCVETTGASPEILSGLLALEESSRTIVARISAPLKLCLERIATRDPTDQIPLDADAIRTVHAMSLASDVRADIELENLALSNAEIASVFRSALDPSAGSSGPSNRKEN